MNRKKIVSAMLIVTLTCGLGLTACGGAQGSVSGTEEAEVQRYAWPLEVQARRIRRHRLCRKICQRKWNG